MANEVFGKVDTLVDLGCGNGRDSLFFARLGMRVIGVDASAEAVKHCRERAEGLDAHFICSHIEDMQLASSVMSHLSEQSKLLVYARFFLHAIDDSSECALFNLVDSIWLHDTKFALEFRTHRDSLQPKETHKHYRRFIDPTNFLTRASRNGYSLDYFVEGFGYSKYRNDDAHVARVILHKP